MVNTAAFSLRLRTFHNVWSEFGDFVRWRTVAILFAIGAAVFTVPFAMFLIATKNGTKRDYVKTILVLFVYMGLCFATWHASEIPGGRILVAFAWYSAGEYIFHKFSKLLEGDTVYLN